MSTFGLIRAYDRGARAGREGRGAEACPCRSPNNRDAWAQGHASASRPQPFPRRDRSPACALNPNI